MRQGICSGSRGEFGRQTDGEFRVQYDESGEQFRVKQHCLASRRFERNHRAAPNFAARPSSRRDTHARRQPAPLLFKTEFGKRLLGSFDQQANGFADIQRAPATKCDDTVAF